MVVVAFSVRIPDPRGGAHTPSDALSYLATYVFNPVTALLIFGTGRTVGYVISRGWIPWRALFNGAFMGLSVAFGAYVYRELGGRSGEIDFSSGYLALVVAPLAQQVANNFFYAYSFSRWKGTPFLSTWLVGIRDLFWPNLLHIPTAIFLAVMYTKLHYLAVAGYLLLLPFQGRALSLYFRRGRLFAQIVDGLVVATDVNFPLSKGHARRVAEIATSIAREMRLSEPMIESIQFAALMHDVGMIGKDDLLDRPVLAKEDVEDLKQHVRVGAEIARELPRGDIATMILRHHERFDGTGYPDGLRGESIPLGARIIALAETIDSMASGSFPYSSPMTLASVLSSIASERGRAFDPDVVDTFLEAVERGAIALVPPDNWDRGISRPRFGESPAR